MESSTPPDATKSDRQIELDQQAVAIAEIVARDRRRRHRTLRTLVALLLITAGLAAVVLAFGRSDKQMIRQTTINEVSQQVPDIVENRVKAHTPSLVTDEVNKQLSSSLIDQKLTPIVKTEVDSKMSSEFTPQIDKLENLMTSLEAAPSSSSYPTEGAFTISEVGRLRKAISQDLPNHTREIGALSGQLDELIAVANTSGGTWNKDKPEIRRQLEDLENEMKSNQMGLATLLKKVDAISERLDGVKDPCPLAFESQLAQFRTYSVKENSKADIYDLRLQVVLKRAKAGIVHGVTVYSDGAQIFGPKDLTMGGLVGFQDDNYRYSLIPIFINRRFLANDFIGLAISRARKCA
jgi:HAMP domain-containing protein